MTNIIQKKKVNLRIFGFLFVLAVVFAMTSLGLIWSYSYIPSGVTTTIHFLYPILVAIIMIFCFKEKKSLLLLVATLLSFVGVLFLCWSEEGVLNILGIVLALITVVTYALYIVGVGKFGIEKINPLIVTFYMLFFGTILFGIYAFTTTGIEPIKNSSEWVNLIILAFLPTVISDFSLILAIKYAGSTISAILGVMEPVVAVCMGVCFFNEAFTLYSIVGLLLVIFAVVIVILLVPQYKRNKT